MNSNMMSAISRKILLFTAAVLCGSVYAKAPVASIPMLTGKAPVIDGVINDQAWKDAAVINNINIKGSSQFAGVSLPESIDFTPAKTEFRICYDNDNIYIAAKCSEQQKGYPEAYPREPGNTLILNDDAVVFVLGDSQDARIRGASLIMGGYDGAYAKLTDAQFYYTYVVNSVGAEMRTFNETPLERPLFDSAVSKGPDGWYVEMKVPFSSAGVNIDRNKEVFANLLRIRPPDMMGWYLPRYGHYVDMPLCKFRFLPAKANSNATKESRTHGLKIKMPAVYKLNIGYYPLGGKIAGIISQTKPQPGSYAVMSVTGFKDKKLMLDKPSEFWQWRSKQTGGASNKEPDIQCITFDIPEGSQKQQRIAELRVYNADGKILQKATRTLEPVKVPYWFGARNKIAVDYAKGGKVLPRWNTPALDGKIITLVNKKLILGDNGLFAKIDDGKGSLLQRPCGLLVDVAGRSLEFKAVKQDITIKNNKVLANSQLRCGQVICDVKTSVDYDGFTVVKLKFSGVNPVEISRVAVQIPVKDDRAKFLYRELAEDVERLDKFGFSSVANQTWIGGRDGGIGFDFDTYDLFLSANRRKQVTVTENDGAKVLTANFVDAAGQIKDKDHVFRFFLLPTPTKSSPRAKVRDYWATNWETWTPKQGYPDKRQVGKLKKWLDSPGMRGRKGLLYIGHGLQASAPGHKEFMDDFDVFPQKVVYWRGGKKSQNACYLTSKLGPAADQQLWEMNGIINEVDIKGIISDGYSMPWDDYNPSHTGNVYQKATWDKPTPSRITLMRDALKQYMGMFAEKGINYHMMDHTGGSFRFSTSSLFDSYLDGEPLARFKHGYQLPLTKFFAFTGQPWGTRMIFWEKRWRKKRGIFWSFTYGFLHDIETSNDPTAMNYRIFKEFDGEATKFLPYWEDNKYINLDAKDSLMTCYLKKDAALVAVGNFTFNTDDVKVNLSKLFPGRKIAVRDMLTGEYLKADGRIVHDELGPWKLLLLRVSPESEKAASPENMKEISGYSAVDWKVAILKAGGKVDFQAKLAEAPAIAMIGGNKASVEAIGLKQPLKNISTLYIKAEIILGRNASKFSFDSNDGFCLNFNGRSGWGLNAQGSIWNKGFCSRNLDVPIESSVLFECAIRNGLVNIKIDGEPVVVDFQMPQTWRPETFVIETRGEHRLTFRPIEISGKAVSIVQQNVQPCEIKGFHMTDWQVSKPYRGSLAREVTLDNVKALKLITKPYGAYARTALRKMVFGKNAYIHLKLNVKNRMNINYGPVQMKFYPYLQMNGLVDGWSNGYINSSVRLRYGRTNDVIIMVNDGVFNIMINGMVAACNMKFDLPVSAENILSIETWAGDYVTVDVVEISNQAKPLPEGITKSIHPVL